MVRFFLSRTLTCQIIMQQILLFFWGKNTYTTLFRPTRLLISEIFPSKPDFYLHKWEKNPSYMALLWPTRLFIYDKYATYTIKWSYTIIWQVRVMKICEECFFKSSNYVSIQQMAKNIQGKYSKKNAQIFKSQHFNFINSNIFLQNNSQWAK